MDETILEDGKIHEIKLFGDSPTTEDELGFDPYANILLDVIENFDAESPLTIGIHGKWGSGKTSLMRMLEKKLNRYDESNIVDAKNPLKRLLTIIHRGWRRGKANMLGVFERFLNKDSKLMRMLEKWLDEGGKKNSVKTIWFNAWAYGRDESIGLALLQQITVELKKEKKFQKKIKKLSENIGELLADAALRKTTGATLKEVKKFSNRFKDDIEIKSTLRDDFKSVIDECLQDRYLFSWNNVPGNDDERLSRYLMNYHDIAWAESAEISKIDEFMFNWDDIPGDDGERLLKYLMNYHDIAWAESAEITKSDDGKIIRISKGENSAEIMIDETEEKVVLKTSDDGTYDLKVKRENGKLNIYIGDKTIRISKDENSAEITMDEKKEKATLKINDARTHNLKVKKEDGKLNIYQNGRLIVFIDDLDRCLPEKTVEILEVMKLFLDVPKCVFVVGVAKDVIEKAIEARYKTNEQEKPILGKDYINKIIQVPFTIPPIREDVMEGFIKNLGIEREELGYVDIVAKGTGCNTRKVKMFLNTLRMRRAIAERTGWKLKADLLAKLYTVEYLFPEFYDDVKAHMDQQLFYKLERLAGGDLYFSWDDIPGDGAERLLRYLTNYHDIAWAESAEIIKIDEFMFSWDDIPGDGAERLLRYLMNYHDIAWAESAEISKSEDGKIIRISKDENSAEITMDDWKEIATLKTSDGITYNLKVKREIGKLNIYIGDKTIRISKDGNSAEITMDEKKEKAALKIGNITTHVMEVKQENDELKICDSVPKELENESTTFKALEEHNKDERLKSLLRDEPLFGRTDIGPYIYLSETLSETETPLPEATKSDEPVLNELLSEDPVKRGAAADSINNMSTTEKQRLLKIVILKLEKGDNFERMKAAPALGKIGGANAVEPLIEALRDVDDVVSENAASALGEIGDKRAIEPLIKTSKDADTNARVRMAAEDALGKIGGEKAVGALIEVLGTENKTVLDELLDEDYQETHDVYLKMYSAAKRINNKMLSSEKRQILNVVIAKLRVEDAFVRRNAAEALGRIGDENAVDPLKEALKEEYEDAGVRRNAAEALGRIGAKEAVDGLIEALKDEVVSEYAAEALGRIGAKEAVDGLIEALKDEIVSEYAAEALGKTGRKEAVDGLIWALANGNKFVRRNAAEALGRIGAKEAVDRLIEALKDAHEDAFVRRNAAEALGRIGDENAVDPLKEALKDEHEDAFVRRNAAEALGKIKDKQNELNREVKKDSSEE